MSTLLDQHCIGILFSQCCQNTSETTLHKKCWLKARRYTFAGKPAVSNISGSLFLTRYYITEQSWVFLFSAESRVYLRIAGQQWARAGIDWNTTILPAMSVSIVWFFTVVKSPSTIRFIVVRWKGFLVGGEARGLPPEKTSKVLFLEGSVSTTCDLNFLPKRFWSPFWSKSAFSLKIFFAFFGVLY